MATNGGHKRFDDLCRSCLSSQVLMAIPKPLLPINCDMPKNNSSSSPPILGVTRPATTNNEGRHTATLYPTPRPRVPVVAQYTGFGTALPCSPLFPPQTLGTYDRANNPLALSFGVSWCFLPLCEIEIAV